MIKRVHIITEQYIQDFKKEVNDFIMDHIDGILDIKYSTSFDSNDRMFHSAMIVLGAWIEWIDLLY